MAQIFNIVLSGGSNAGKTELMPKLKEYLGKCGFGVVTVPESATQLLQMGYTPDSGFQLNVALNQFYNEDLAENIAVRKVLATEKDVVVLHDRSFIDQFAYGDAETILSFINEAYSDYLVTDARGFLKYDDLVARYDFVVHLQSNAHNNHVSEGRLETQEEAIELEKKTLEANAKHPRMRYIPAQKSIETKLHLLEHVVLNNILELMEEKS